jgi:AtzE family amidohydrolase
MKFDALALAAAVRAGQVRAVDIAQASIARIHARLDLLAVTRCLAERALDEAAAVDAMVARGEDPGPLAGVPYGVKDLFDVAGLATTAGSASRIDAAPAARDAVAIERLRAAGAVLVATLNMDEFAYGFVTDNAHWGITRNPHDPARFAGGSSGGSAAAVAAGLVAFALGSDTNGSIRIPAALCGVFGNKPTHGSLPMDGVFPFVDSLDDIGAFARSAADLAVIDAVLRQDNAVPDFVPRPAVLDGWFERNLTPAMRFAFDLFTIGFPRVSLDRVDKARSAAFLMTAYEGGRFHLPALRDQALAYDPAVRDRLIAGAALPEAVYRAALDWRTTFIAQVEALLDRHKVLIAPVVMGEAPRIDDPVVVVDGERQPARANLGLYTQPISFCGLPVVSAPLPVRGLPLGVQLIGARGSDRALLQWAAGLEARGDLAPKLEETC